MRTRRKARRGAAAAAAAAAGAAAAAAAIPETTDEPEAGAVSYTALFEEVLAADSPPRKAGQVRGTGGLLCARGPPPRHATAARAPRSATLAAGCRRMCRRRTHATPNPRRHPRTRAPSRAGARGGDPRGRRRRRAARGRRVALRRQPHGHRPPVAGDAGQAGAAAALPRDEPRAVPPHGAQGAGEGGAGGRRALRTHTRAGRCARCSTPPCLLLHRTPIALTRSYPPPAITATSPQEAEEATPMDWSPLPVRDQVHGRGGGRGLPGLVHTHAPRAPRALLNPPCLLLHRKRGAPARINPRRPSARLAHRRSPRPRSRRPWTSTARRPRRWCSSRRPRAPAG